MRTSSAPAKKLPSKAWQLFSFFSYSRRMALRYVLTVPQYGSLAFRSHSPKLPQSAADVVGGRGTSNGYVAIMAVLVLGAACVSSITILLVNGTYDQHAAFISQSSFQARSIAHGCMEEALQQIHDDNGFAATNNPVNLGAGIWAASCTYTITNLTTSTRQIDTTSTVNGVVRKTQALITIGTTTTTITSWFEVP
jgi:hypothetical protein